MAQFSTTVRNARGNAIETAIGASAVLELRSGAAPASAASADSGVLLASMALPADWLAATAAGVTSKSGTWEDPNPNAAGVVGHYRIKATDGVTCHIQGPVSLAGGGAEMILSDTTLAVDVPVSITSFNITEGNG